MLGANVKVAAYKWKSDSGDFLRRPYPLSQAPTIVLQDHHDLKVVVRIDPTSRARRALVPMTTVHVVAQPHLDAMVEKVRSRKSDK